MVRGLTKEVEGIIAIVIFVLFIIFYFNTLNLGIFNRVRLYQSIYTKNSLVDSIFNSLLKEGYIITLNVTIPKYSEEFACNISDDELRYDFCERFPIFYPLNISFLTNQTGVLNNTDDTLLDPNIGIFFYANFSEFYCEEDEGYTIVKIYNPFNHDLNDIYVLLMSPTIYYWLNNSYYINLNNSYTYCYLNTSGYCTNSTNNSIGIVINIINIEENSSIYLNISRSNINNAKYLGELNVNFNLTSLPYEIVYEPLCYKEYNFIISDEVNYNFSEYNDLACSNEYLSNSYLSFDSIQHNLIYIFPYYKYYFSNMTLANESGNPINNFYNISCVSSFNSSLGEVSYIVFSNTSWFIASLSENINDFVNLVYWNNYGGLYFDYYFYINYYNSFSNPNSISYFNSLFERSNEYGNFYGFSFLSSAPVISYYRNKKYFKYFNMYNISYYPKENGDKTIVYFYLINSTDSYLPESIYYQFRIPNIELSRITKVLYIYPEDLINQNITFSIENLNITYGNPEDEGFSKTYYSYILYNNTLIKDYITIYLK